MVCAFCSLKNWWTKDPNFPYIRYVRSDATAVDWPENCQFTSVFSSCFWFLLGREIVCFWVAAAAAACCSSSKFFFIFFTFFRLFNTKERLSSIIFVYYQHWRQTTATGVTFSFDFITTGTFNNNYEYYIVSKLISFILEKKSKLRKKKTVFSYHHLDDIDQIIIVLVLH